MHVITVDDDSLVVALDRGVDDSDGTVARSVDIDSVDDVGASRRTVDNGEKGAASRHFRVVERVEIACQHDRRQRTRRRYCVDPCLDIV